jgi:PAS domain S-box-containing protein
MDSSRFLDSMMPQVIELAGIGYSVQSTADQVIRWSPQLEQLYGLKVGTFAGTFEAFISLVYVEDQDYVRHECYRAMRPIAQTTTAEGCHYSFMCRPAADPQQWLQHQGHWVWNEQGKLVKVIEVVSDVSKLRRTHTQLLNLNRRLESLLQSSAVLIVQVDPTGIIGDVMPHADTGLGRLFWQTLGQNLLELILPDDRPQLDSALAIWATGTPYPLRFRVSADAAIVLEAIGNLPPPALGRTGVFLTLREVTEQAAMEAEMLAQRQQQEQQWQSMLNHPTVALFRCATDAERTVTLIGEAIAQISGYPAHTFLGSPGLLQLCHPDDRAQVQMALWQATAHQQPYQIEYRTLTAAGQIRWVAEQGHLVRNVSSQAVSIAGMIWDMSEFKAQLTAQEHCHSLLETLIESTADGIIAIDIEANLTHYNQKFLEIWGLSKEAIEALDDWQLITFMAGQMSNPHQFWQQVRQESLQPEWVGHGWIDFKDGRRLERCSFPHWLNGKIVGRVVSYRERIGTP